jgi:hypothetical protein
MLRIPKAANEKGGQKAAAKIRNSSNQFEASRSSAQTTSGELG